MPAKIDVDINKEGEYCLIKVSDNGIGVSRILRRRYLKKALLETIRELDWVYISPGKLSSDMGAGFELRITSQRAPHLL